MPAPLEVWQKAVRDRGDSRMADAVSSAGGAPAAADEFARRHHALLDDKALQFKFDKFQPIDTPPLPPSKTPDWYFSLGDFLNGAAPVLQFVFWGGVALLVALVLWMVGRAVMHRLDRPKRMKEEAPAEPAAPIEFRPERERAAALLAEADRLAREGRFAEAVRVLLHRTIEDMEKALSLRIGVSMTSREIEQFPALSPLSRGAFSIIARAVETSLFAGRPIDGTRFAECRSAYESFAFGRDGR